MVCYNNLFIITINGLDRRGLWLRPRAMFCTQLGISFSLERKCWSTVPGWLIRGLFIQTNNFIHWVFLWGLCFIVYPWINVAQSSAGQLFRVSGINSWLIYKDRDSFEELIYSDFPGVLLFLRKTTELRAAPWHSKSLWWYVTHTTYLWHSLSIGESCFPWSGWHNHGYTTASHKTDNHFIQLAHYFMHHFWIHQLVGSL